MYGNFEGEDETIECEETSLPLEARRKFDRLLTGRDCMRIVRQEQAKETYIRTRFLTSVKSTIYSKSSTLSSSRIVSELSTIHTAGSIPQRYWMPHPVPTSHSVHFFSKSGW